MNRPYENSDESAHPERFTAALIAAELKRVLGAEGEMEELGPAHRRYHTPGGATVTLDMHGGRVIVATDRYRLDLTVTPEHLAIGYIGEYGAEAFTALFLLDLLHENGLLPTDISMPSAQHLADRADQQGAPAA